MRTRQEIIEKNAKVYQKANKKQKSVYLDELTKVTGLNKKYLSHMLSNYGKKVYLGKTVFIAKPYKRRKKFKRKKKYDEEFLQTLKKVWAFNNFSCGKRLKPILPEFVIKLKQFNEIDVSADVERKLSDVSASTIDRLLVKERKKIMLKGRSHTKPGTMLKHQIKIRTFADWDEQKPGFLEIDLVGHDGGTLDGEHCFTLDATDIHTGWTETAAIKNKSASATLNGLVSIRNRLPFDLLGIDSDNGSEFINHHLFRYCDEQELTFTRGRSYKKNDGCFIEQKNYSIVRKYAGYMRYDTDQQLLLLNKMYSLLRLYTNFFQTHMKLIYKERSGAKVYKKYDSPLTPYQRVLISKEVSSIAKDYIQGIYDNTNPAELLRQINKIQQQLLRSVKKKYCNNNKVVLCLS